MQTTVIEKKTLKYRLIMAIIPLATGLIRLIGLTMRFTLIDPQGVSPFAKPKTVFIYSIWHNQQVMATYFFRNHGIYALISRSKDGDYVSEVMAGFGFKTVRSSSSSGKINALRGLARALADGHHTVITPDGPRGPVYHAQPGPVFLSALSQQALVPFGCAVDRAWRLKSWDRFEIPKPFSRAIMVFDQAMAVPRQLTNEAAQQLTLTLEAQMNTLQQRARKLLSHTGKG